MRPARLYASAAELTDGLCRWLEKVDKPFLPGPTTWTCTGPTIPETLTILGIAQAWQDLAIMGERSNFDARTPITAAQRNRFLGLYEQSLGYIDSQIGRLMDSLKRFGHDDDTAIIVVSDHGEEFLDHGRWGHWESNSSTKSSGAAEIRTPHGQAGRSSGGRFACSISCQRFWTWVVAHRMA
jgi:arylsulfatase A-like enzyme